VPAEFAGGLSWRRYVLESLSAPLVHIMDAGTRFLFLRWLRSSSGLRQGVSLSALRWLRSFPARSPRAGEHLDSSAPPRRPLRSLSQSPADRSRVPQCTRWRFRSAPGVGDSEHGVLIFDPFRYELHRWGSFHHGKDVLVVRDDDFENLSSLEHTYTESA
jgi:hypothetical protein